MNLTFRPVLAEDDVHLYRLMDSQDYLSTTLDQMGITREQFRASMHSTGEIHAILADGHLAGFYWIELRGRTLHLHGLVLEGIFQGQGIGTHVIASLARSYHELADAMELGVHSSNHGAIRLYERLGFQTVRFIDNLGFLIMQKPLGPEAV